LDPAQLEVLKHLFSSVAEEMGAVLRRTSYSPNIKERRDYSCAVFDACGRMIAQAAHIPVHLGSMPLSVEECVASLDFEPGDVAVLNDPYRGGTHLPDITFVAPVFGDGASGTEPAYGRDVPDSCLIGFVASRAHHADVGGLSPGSMPLSGEVFQEGLIIPPVKLVRAGVIDLDLWGLLLANVRTPDERAGDLRAQLAAGRTGARRLAALAERYGRAELSRYMQGLLDYAERATRRLIAELPDGEYRFRDALDPTDSDEELEIQLTVTIGADEVVVDFTGTSPQSESNLNAVYAVTLSATAYVFRSLIGLDVPSNSGCLVPIHVIAPKGTLVNARRPAAVAAGNVETSQRITDVLLGALAQACPERVPAASQGTMNNLTIGGRDLRYELREGSGGTGRFRGGDGIRRDYEFLSPAIVTLLSESRVRRPYGLAGGEPGSPGIAFLTSRGKRREVPGRAMIEAEAGDVLSVRTPGGGGYGRPGRAGGHEALGATGDTDC
jgi:N-methylhydantoinase B